MTVQGAEIRPAPAAALAAAIEGLAADLAAGRAPDAGRLAPTRLSEAQEVFGLSAGEAVALALLAGAALSGGFARALAARSGEEAVTAGGLVALVPGLGWESLAPGAVLRAWRLVQLHAAMAPRLCPAVIDERLLGWLRGVPGLDARLAHASYEIAPRLPLMARYAAEVPRIAGAIAAAAARGRPAQVAVVGAGRETRRAVAAAVAESLRMAPLGLWPEALQPGREATALIARLIAREMVLERVLPVFELATAAEAGVARGLEGPALLLAPAGPLPRTAERAGPVFALGPPDAGERAQLWSMGLGVAPAEAAALAEAFTLEADEIAALAEELPADGGGDVVGRAWAAARRALAPPPDPLVTAIEPRAGWADIVLPAATEATLRAIAAQCRRRATVYRDWGFAGPTARGLGVTALFTGPSGTGKTLAAEVMARELGRLLLRVDLAQVVDKFVGETEKHLDRAFALAERSGAVLLFDEADALFRRRGDGDAAGERFGAMTVAYLLQRLETATGIAILTTNLRGVIDDAFLRRIRFAVHFAFPSQEERRRLWRGAIPAAAPSGAIDIEALARLPAAGGTIRTVVLNAAFLAADDGGRLEMRHVVRALEIENAKLEQGLDLGGLRRRLVR